MERHAPRLVVAAIWGTAVLAIIVALGSAPGVSAQDQAIPTFRSSVDLVAVEVQVVGDDGTPIGGLGPDDFEVSISGGRRQVISADYIRSTTIDGRPFEASNASTALTATNVWPTNPNPAARRIYVLAFDIGSLSVSDSRAVVGSALTFIDRLLPSDFVGLYTFPTGSRLEPTTAHGGVKQLVSQVVGTSQGYLSRFHLSPSEIIDINAEATRAATLTTATGRGGGGFDAAFAEGGVLRDVQIRECGLEDGDCVERVVVEAQALGYYLEGRATVGLNGLRALIDALAEYPGRKTVVMFSSGIPVSDRPGGRPDIGELAKTLGQAAASTNTTIYTVHMDSAEFKAMSAETAGLAGTPGTRSRDFIVGGRILDQFSGASGGTLMRVLTGSAEYALDRVLRETSSRYLLGVAPDDADRDGRVRTLNVKVNVDDVTVRSRTWVVVPAAGGA